MKRFGMGRMAAVALMLSAPAMFAVDGQVLLNQASITAAGGFPYHITQPGSYKLSGNLVGVPNQAVFLIESSNVTLDLNGFNVQCGFTDAIGFNIAACITDNRKPFNGVTVRNGSVSVLAAAAKFNFQSASGVDLSYSVGSTVEDVHFSGTGTNFSLNGLNSGKGFIIRRNTFSQSASPSTSCPSIVESNVNQTLAAGSNGTGCVASNNVGSFALL